MNQEKKYYIFEMNGVILQVISIIILIVMIILTAYLSDGIFMTNKDLELIFLLIIPYLILHELLHSLAYVINGAKFKNITYGAHLEKGILCCLCKQNISKRNILISLLFPFVIIGVITYIIGTLTNNIVLIWLSILNISGCSADLIMFFELLKLKDFEYSEYDNPVAFGLYTSKNLSKTKLFGLKYIGETKALEKNNMKKISISKFSIITFIIFIILGIWLIFLT
ncbi:uncharacterized protein BN793_00912 [Firmicutes bacterium CAG:822]|nr:uncharacterized protein BN793_00912 [Firmicutes bacterium CAG:822]